MKKAMVQKKKAQERKSAKLRELSISEKEEIYRQHIGLVVFIAKRYIGKSPNFTFEDLIQEGILGLFKAAERFDKQKGYKFSTYASWWIRQAITRALTEQGRTIRIPISMLNALKKYAKTERMLLKKLGREPLAEEMAAEMGTNVKRIRQIKKFLESPSKIIPLKEVLGGNKENASSEFLKNEEMITPEKLAFRNFLKEDLKKFFREFLTEREKEIIEMRFGLKDGIAHTLEEISQETGLSRERVRQIIKESLKKLKKSKKIKSPED